MPITASSSTQGELLNFMNVDAEEQDTIANEIVNIHTHRQDSNDNILNSETSNNNNNNNNNSINSMNTSNNSDSDTNNHIGNNGHNEELFPREESDDLEFQLPSIRELLSEAIASYSSSPLPSSSSSSSPSSSSSISNPRSNIISENGGNSQINGRASLNISRSSRSPISSPRYGTLRRRSNVFFRRRGLNDVNSPSPSSSASSLVSFPTSPPSSSSSSSSSSLLLQSTTLPPPPLLSSSSSSSSPSSSSPSPSISNVTRRRATQSQQQQDQQNSRRNTNNLIQTVQVSQGTQNNTISSISPPPPSSSISFFHQAMNNSAAAGSLNGSNINYRNIANDFVGTDDNIDIDDDDDEMNNENNNNSYNQNNNNSYSENNNNNYSENMINNLLSQDSTSELNQYISILHSRQPQRQEQDLVEPQQQLSQQYRRRHQYRQQRLQLGQQRYGLQSRLREDEQDTASFIAQLSVQNCPPILEGCIMTATNLEEKTKQNLLLNCKLLGAKTQSYYDPTCTHLITPYQKGEEYEIATANLANVVSLQWLSDCIGLRQYISPFKPVVHYPIKNRGGIPEMRQMVISVTGFIGEERNDLKFLIKSCGAKYSGALSKKENTHLICCIPEGEKFRKALEWNIKIVSKKWLYDCVSQWKKIHENLYCDIDVDR